MKGLQALENEIMSARRRLVKMRDAGRLGSTTQAIQYTEELDRILGSANMYVNLLRNYEVGRCADQDNISTERSE